MFNQLQKIDDTAIKVAQVKTLMELLIEYRDSMPKKTQDDIIHIAHDILFEQTKELMGLSAELSGK
ncbi:MAG: hypothetical protein AB1815_02385 [Bacillota bacterium]